MSALQPLSLLLNINPREFRKEELLFFEAEFFMHLCEEINKIIIEKNKDYFQFDKEKIMLEINLIRFIINDILSTKEYNLLGIALYTNVPEDVIYDLASGYNINPTLSLARKIIELHRMTRPTLYQEIADKIKQRLFIAA